MTVSNQISAFRPVRSSVFGSTVLWISGAQSDQSAVDALLAGLGLTARRANGVQQVLAELRDRPSMLCFLDCTRTTGDALRVARSIRTERPQAIIVGIVDPNRQESSLDSFRAGVFDVLP